MKLFAGLTGTDYQDVLRALGAWLDGREWRDVRIWEHADGIVVQGRAGGDAEYETVLMTDDDLHALLTEAYRKRGGTAPGCLQRRR